MALIIKRRSSSRRVRCGQFRRPLPTLRVQHAGCARRPSAVAIADITRHRDQRSLAASSTDPATRARPIDGGGLGPEVACLSRRDRANDRPHDSPLLAHRTASPQTVRAGSESHPRGDGRSRHQGGQEAEETGACDEQLTSDFLSKLEPRPALRDRPWRVARQGIRFQHGRRVSNRP